jgi:hypothetical protein
MHGKGILSWSDGRSYVGDYKQNKENGFGNYTWPDGKMFAGMWKDGKREGKGINYFLSQAE